MTMLPNSDRAERARKIIETYNDEWDAQANVIDLLTDIQHYLTIARARDVRRPTFDKVLETARDHFEAELLEERNSGSAAALTVKLFDNYEISGCKEYIEDDGRRRYYEVVEDSKADVWTLYGHSEGEGVIAIGDFKNREDAEEVYAKIVGEPFTACYEAHPALRLRNAAPAMRHAIEGCLYALDGNADGYGPNKAQAIGRARAALTAGGEAKAAEAPPLLHAMLDIKRIAGKSGDSDADPFALLDLIADRARAALSIATKQ